MHNVFQSIRVAPYRSHSWVLRKRLQEIIFGLSHRKFCFRFYLWIDVWLEQFIHSGFLRDRSGPVFLLLTVKKMLIFGGFQGIYRFNSVSKIWPCQSMHIYLKYNPVKFHPDPVWNDGALDFLKRSPQQEQEQQQGEYKLYCCYSMTIYMTSYGIRSWSKNRK